MRSPALLLALAAVPVMPMVPEALAAQNLPIRITGLAGLNRTSATGVGPIDAQLGGTVGLSATLEFSRLFGLRTEALLSRRALRGFSADDQLVCPLEQPCTHVPLGHEETRLTDLEFPLLFEVRAPKDIGAVRPFAYAGPFMALRLRCSRASGVEASGTLVAPCESETSLPTYYSDVDGGLVVGGGVRVGVVGVGLRWTRGYVPIVPFQTAGREGLMNGKSSSLAFLLEVGGRLGN